MTIPYTKPALTFPEQLDLLESRGLLIPDRTTAETILSRISYYRFSAYCLPFQNILDQFHEGTTWDTVMGLYEFDRQLRLLVMDALERVEVAIRTDITYTLAHAYGAFGYLDAAHFRLNFNHAQWLEKLTGEIVKSHEIFIRHFRDKYDGFPRLPIWMASEVMSFGSLSRLYEGMVDKDQQRVSSRHALPHFVLRSWLRSLSVIRNICAHHSRLWNREIPIAPVMPLAKHGWLPNEIPNQKRLFAVLIMLRHLMDGQCLGEGWQAEVTRLIEPIACDDNFKLVMGLPEGWQTHRRWLCTPGGRP